MIFGQLLNCFIKIILKIHIILYIYTIEKNINRNYIIIIIFRIGSKNVFLFILIVIYKIIN